MLVTLEFFSIQQKIIKSVWTVDPLHEHMLWVAFAIHRQPSQWRSAAYHSRQQWGAASAHRRCSYDVCTHAAASLPRSCNQHGLGRGCWAARGPADEVSCFLLQQLDGVTGAMSQPTILLEHECVISKGVVVHKIGEVEKWNAYSIAYSLSNNNCTKNY